MSATKMYLKFDKKNGTKICVAIGTWDLYYETFILTE